MTVEQIVVDTALIFIVCTICACAVVYLVGNMLGWWK